MSAPSRTDQSAARRWRLMTGRNGTNYWNSRRLPGGGGVVGFSSVSAGNNRLSQANTPLKPEAPGARLGARSYTETPEGQKAARNSLNSFPRLRTIWFDLLFLVITHNKCKFPNWPAKCVWKSCTIKEEMQINKRKWKQLVHFLIQPWLRMSWGGCQNDPKMTWSHFLETCLHVTAFAPLPRLRQQKEGAERKRMKTREVFTTNAVKCCKISRKLASEQPGQWKTWTKNTTLKQNVVKLFLELRAFALYFLILLWLMFTLVRVCESL